MSSYRLSIIIPVYNVQEYILDCVRSIARQNLAQCEVILVDDGSTDDSISQVRHFIGQQHLLHWRILEKKNGGLSSARNFGLEAADGDYVWFVDSDDMIVPGAVDVLLQNLSHFSNPDLVAFQFVRYEHTVPSIKVTQSTSVESENGEQFIQSLFERSREDFAWSYITKAEVLIKNSIRFPDGRTFEDMATTYKIGYFSSTVILLPSVLYLYRVRKNSISNSRSLQHATDVMVSLHECVSFFKTHESSAYNKHFSNFGAYYALFAYQQTYTKDMRSQMNQFFAEIDFKKISKRYRLAYFLANIHLLRLFQQIRLLFQYRK